MTGAAEPALLLRAGVLDGIAVVLATRGGQAGAQRLPDSASGAAGGVEGAEAIERACAGLGARVARCGIAPEAEGAPDDAPARGAAVEMAVRGALADLGGEAQLLVVDGRGWFAAKGGREALVDCMQASWDITRALANAAFLPEERGGRIVLLAPPEGAEHAAAAAAGLENLARTLSIEWARFGVTTVAVAPGAGTAEGELATVVAYLASAAGSYFSGCLMDMRGPRP